MCLKIRIDFICVTADEVLIIEDGSCDVHMFKDVQQTTKSPMNFWQRILLTSERRKLLQSSSPPMVDFSFHVDQFVDALEDLPDGWNLLLRLQTE